MVFQGLRGLNNHGMGSRWFVMFLLSTVSCRSGDTVTTNSSVQP